MIEINLIPDVKREMLRAQKMRNTTISISIITALVAGGIVVMLGALVGAQALHETVARNNVKEEFRKLQNTPDIDKALTIREQLGAISEINDKKSINSRLLDIVAAINPPAPNDIKYSLIRVDPMTKTLYIEAMAVNSYSATDTFRKLILNTKVESTTADGTVNNVPLTDSVSITDANYGENSEGVKVLSFKASFVYPDGLLDNTLAGVRVVTPAGRIDVTDSHTRVPASLFGEAAKSDENTGGNN